MHPMTRANLEAALAGEAMAALRYRLFADRARQDDMSDMEDLFESIAQQERREHARELAEALGVVRTTRENLAAALEGEILEHRRLFPVFAAQARRVGDYEVAEMFEQLGREEHVNAERFRLALSGLTRAPATG